MSSMYQPQLEQTCDTRIAKNGPEVSTARHGTGSFWNVILAYFCWFLSLLSKVVWNRSVSAIGSLFVRLGSMNKPMNFQQNDLTCCIDYTLFDLATFSQSPKVLCRLLSVFFHANSFLFTNSSRR